MSFATQITASKQAASSRRPGMHRIATLLAALLLALMLATPGGASGSPAPAGARGQPGHSPRSPQAVASHTPQSSLTGVPFMVKDINTVPVPPDVDPPDLNLAVTLNNTLYFIADDDIHGLQIWKSDGTAVGTARVSDIDGITLQLTLFNGSLYFMAIEGGQTGLWRSDGIRAGTVLVKALEGLGPAIYDSINLTAMNGALFFMAEDGYGVELWISDGTAAGTHLLKDINPGPGSAFRLESEFLPISIGSAFLFVVDDGVHGDELWRSDGTAAGTRMVKDINPGPGSIFDYIFPRMTKVNNRVLFTADDGVHGLGLWASDGTNAGTQLLKPINSLSYAFSHTNLATINGALFFGADDGVLGYELWRSDGTPQGTTLVKDINPGPPGSFLSLTDLDPVSVNGRLFFSAYDGVHGSGLWTSDGTPAGTILFKDLGPGSLSIPPENLIDVNGRLFFTQNDNLWTSDGTPAGTIALTTNAGDFNPLTGFSSLIGMNGTLFAFKGGDQAGLWRSDGTIAGTLPVKSFKAGGPMTIFNNTLLFFADDGVHGFELWRSDGTPAGTALVKNIVPEVSNAIDEYRSLTAANVNGTLFFVADDGVHGDGLWASRGTEQSTRLVKGTTFGVYIAPEQLTRVNNTLFFISAGSLWKSDGTEAGTVVVVQSYYKGSRVIGLINVNGVVFFIEDNGTLSSTDEAGTHFTFLATFTDNYGAPGIQATWDVNGKLFINAYDGQNYRLWTSDGTAEGTAPVDGIVPDGPIPWLEVVNGTWFFAFDDGVHGTELWRSDGTPGSARLLKDIAPGTASANVSVLAVVGRTLYFSADDGIHGAELWKSDGTEAGTTLIKDIAPGPNGSQFSGATAAGNQLFFVTQDPSHGRELWRSDSTASGTRLVKDIRPGPRSGLSWRPMISVDDQVLFEADDGVHGNELWKSDGTAAGTTLIADIAPGSDPSDPAGFTVAGPYLFFSADDRSHGKELWALPLHSYPFRRTTVGLGALVQAEDFDRGGERLAYHDRDPFNRGGAYRPDEWVDLQADAGSSGGVHLAWTQAGEWLEYTVDVAQTQTYTLTVRVAAQGAGGVFHIALDGVDWAGPLRIPDTGGWYSWRTLEKSGLRLTAGRHTLRLVLDADGAISGVGNIDWFSLLAPAKERVFLPEVH